MSKERYMRVEVFKHNDTEEGIWEETTFRTLKDEDRFRMYDPYTDAAYKGNDGKYEWIVDGEPFHHERYEDVWAVNIRK